MRRDTDALGWRYVLQHFVVPVCVPHSEQSFGPETDDLHEVAIRRLQVMPHRASIRLVFLEERGRPVLHDISTRWLHRRCVAQRWRDTEHDTGKPVAPRTTPQQRGVQGVSCVTHQPPRTRRTLRRCQTSRRAGSVGASSSSNTAVPPSTAADPLPPQRAERTACSMGGWMRSSSRRRRSSAVAAPALGSVSLSVTTYATGHYDPRRRVATCPATLCPSSHSRIQWQP